MRMSVSPERFQRFALWAIWSLAAIVVTGVAVRLTGSGLGCPDWPTCEDKQLVSPWEYHAVIEFGNRLVTGLVSLAVALAVLGSIWRRPKRMDLIWWSLGLVAGVGAQVLLGRWVVTSHLTPWIVMAHFLVSMVLLWNAIVLYHRAKLPDDGVGTAQTSVAQQTGPHQTAVTPTHHPAVTPTHHPAVRFLMWLIGAVTVWVLVSGTIVTGAGPHGGDEDAERLNYDISNVARIHAIGVIVLLVLVLWMFWILSRHESWGHYYQSTYALLGVILAQGFIGYVQYFNDVPELLVGIHVAGAISVWWAMLNLHLTVLPPKRLGAKSSAEQQLESNHLAPSLSGITQPEDTPATLSS